MTKDQTPLQQFCDIQERLLSDSEIFTRHWFERRHGDLRTALQLATDLSEKTPGDPMVAAQLLRDWQMRTTESLNVEMQEWIALWTRSAEHLALGEAAATTEAMTAVSERARDTGHRHATPV